MNAHMPTILIIVGITGDLSKRKLLPALGALAAAHVLPRQLRIVGITRQHTITLDSLLEGVTHAEHLRANTELFSMSLTNAADYERLSAHLLTIELALGGRAQHLWYLSVPPETAWPIIEQLGNSGLAKAPNTKLLLEKPFGIDERSARELAEHIEHSFPAKNVYRIDHYLAKETVQNIVSFRRDNPFFEHAWNRDAIERIDILASETIGIEGRTTFYEQTGALRDLIQSHLLQLAALTLMTLPKGDDRHNIPKARLALLQTLHVDPDHIHCGQYENYREEVSNPVSSVETFASLTFLSTDPRWLGVPITITTGKALALKKTEIVITYRRNGTIEANQLTIKIQPDEGIELRFFAKRPGYDHITERVPLAFMYTDHFDTLPDAYEHIFLGVLCDDHTLFVSNDEVHESWRIVDTARKEVVLHARKLISYPRGATVEQVLARNPF